jgi:hypothetical protein
VVQALGQAAGRLEVDVDLLDHVDGQADRAGLVHDRPLDGLADPPGGVGGEAEAALGVELLHRADQAEVALLDQVEQRQAAVEIAPGDLHHQAQVAHDHALAGGAVPLLGQARVVAAGATHRSGPGGRKWTSSSAVEQPSGAARSRQGFGRPTPCRRWPPRSRLDIHIFLHAGWARGPHRLPRTATDAQPLTRPIGLPERLCDRPGQWPFPVDPRGRAPTARNRWACRGSRRRGAGTRGGDGAGRRGRSPGGLRPGGRCHATPRGPSRGHRRPVGRLHPQQAPGVNRVWRTQPIPARQGARAEPLAHGDLAQGVAGLDPVEAVGNGAASGEPQADQQCRGQACKPREWTRAPGGNPPLGNARAPFRHDPTRAAALNRSNRGTAPRRSPAAP